MSDEEHARRGRKTGRPASRKPGTKGRRAATEPRRKTPRVDPARKQSPKRPAKQPPRTAKARRGATAPPRATKELRSRAAQRQLFALLYDTLRGYARGMMAGQRRNHTLQPTALVNSAYEKLFGKKRTWTNREHFIAAIVQAMGQLLVDHARRANAEKRGPGRQTNDVDPDQVARETDDSRPDMDDWAQVAASIEVLAKEDAAAALVARCRLFGGFEFADIATIARLSLRTVERKWTWVFARLQEIHG